MEKLAHDGDAVTVQLEQAADKAARDALLARAMSPNWKKKTSQKLRSGRLPADGLAFVARDNQGLIVGTVRLWNIQAGIRSRGSRLDFVSHLAMRTEEVRAIPYPHPEVRAQRASKDEDSIEPVPALMLGPLAIDPVAKGTGVGSILMRHAVSEAARLGHGAVLLVGDAPYYARFGFSTEKTGALALPGPVERDRFLAIELIDGWLDGAAGMVVPTGRKAQKAGKLRLVA